MYPTLWHLLFIDDDDDEYFITREMLRLAGSRCTVERAATYEAGREALARGTYDAVLVDYDLGVHKGLELIREFAKGYPAPFILLTGRGNFEVDVEAMQAGAADYLNKNEVSGAFLERSIRYAIERKRARDELEQERLRLQTIINNAPSGILLTDRQGEFILSNPAVDQIYSGGVTGDAYRENGGYTLHRPDGSPFDPKELPLSRSLAEGIIEQNVEVLVRNNDGRDVTVLVNSSPLHDPYGKVQGAVAVLTDISERKRAEAERERLLEENRQHQDLLERIFEASPTGLALVSVPDFTFTLMNPAYRALLPYPDQDPIGRTVEEVFPTQVGFKGAVWIEQVYRTRQPFSADRVERIYPDGSRHFKSMRILPLTPAPDSPMLMLAWDTTPFEEAYREAEEGKRVLDALMEYIPAGVNIYEMQDGEPNLRLVSHYVERLTKQAGQSLLGATAAEQSQTWELYAGDSATPLAPEEWPVTQVTRTGEEITSRPMVISGPAGKIPVLANAGPIKDQDGRITGAIVTFVDNTAQKKLEEELRAIFASIADAVVVHDIQGAPMYANAPAVASLGYDPTQRPEEAIHDHIQLIDSKGHVLAPDEMPLGRALRGENINGEYYLLEAPGKARQSVVVSASPLLLNGEVSGVVIVWHDISEREQLMEQLEAERARLEAVLQSLPVGVWIADLDGRVITKNQQTDLIWAGNAPLPGSIGEYALYRARWPENGQALQADEWPLAQALRTGDPQTAVEVEIQRYDGTTGVMMVSASPVLDAEGHILGGVAVGLDITQRKQIEQQLETALDDALNEHNRLLAVMEALPVGLAIYNRQGGVTLTNRKFEEVWGEPRPPAESVDDYDAYQAWWTDTGERVQPKEWAAAQSVQNGEAVIGQSMRIQRFDGTQAYILNSGVPIFDAQGQVIGAAVTIMDVTGRILAEQSLRDSEARFRTLADAMPQLVWTANPDGQIDYVNRRIEEYHQWRQESAPGGALAPVTDPEDLETVAGAWQRAIAGQTIYQSEHRLQMADGSFRWHLSRGLPIHDEAGQVVKWYGTSTDIHEQKMTEQALRESEHRFQVAFSAAPIAVFNQDRDLRYTWIFQPQGGYEPGQITGKTDMDLLPAEDGGELVALKRSVMESGKGVQKELIIRLGGEVGNYIVNIVPLFDEEGQVVGITGSSFDVTVQRHLEANEMENRARVEVQRRLMQQREMERMNIARDLHDGPLQELLLVSYGLAEALEINERQPRVEKLKEAQRILSDQMAELRRFCNELRPPMLAPFGLEKAIRAHTDAFQERHPELNIHMNLMPDGRILPEEKRMALFRVYQELLNNINKHAKAHEVHVSLEVTEEEVILEVEDDGVGFDLPRDWVVLMRGGHLGLIGLRERVDAIGGSLRIQSAPGRGARVRITAPRKEPEGVGMPVM